MTTSTTTPKTRPSQLKAVAKYNREHAVWVRLKLIDTRDTDIIAKLESQPSKQGYIKALIRKDIKESEE